MLDNTVFELSQVVNYLASMTMIGFVYIFFSRRYTRARFDFNHTHFYIGLLFSLMTSFIVVNLGFDAEEEKLFVLADEELDIIELDTPRTIHEKKKVPPPPVIRKKKKSNPIVSEIKTFLNIDEPVEDTPPRVDTSTVILQDIATDAVAPRVEPKIEKASDEIVFIAEQMPRFPGCEDMVGSNKEKEKCAQEKMLQYIYKNLKYPLIARENRVEGVAVIRFVVDKNGSVKDVKLMRELGAGCGDAAKHVINAMNDLPQKWTPGKQRGRPVNVLYTLPIKFKLQ